MSRRYTLFAAAAGLVVLFDQITKYYIHEKMPLHSSIPVIEGFFNLTYIRNPGAAFGFLATAPPAFRAVFFIAVTVAAILLILYYVRRYGSEEPQFMLPLSLIIGGAVGNLVDRVRFGDVIDFLDVYIGTHHWPAFNVADSAISVGALLLLYEMLRKMHRSG